MSQSPNHEGTRTILRNDWDPASSVGLTATEAAAARAVASRHRSPLINDPYAGPLVDALGVEFFTRLVQQNADTESAGFAMPGMVDWVAARTRFFDDFFAATQTAGIRQSVILGAGLDSRAFRLAWSPGATVYEVDQPGVVDFKSTAMARMHAHPLVDRRTVAADLRDDWVSPLRQNGFDPSLPTVWSAEGLLAYLPSDAQRQLLDDICELSSDGSWFAADVVADIGDFAAQIASLLDASERPAQIKVDIGAVASPESTRFDAAGHLRHREWAAMSFAAADLLAAYDLAVPAAENVYGHIHFVTAFHGHGSVAGI